MHFKYAAKPATALVGLLLSLHLPRSLHASDLWETARAKPLVVKAESFRHYVEEFNRNDNELHKGYFQNASTWEFLEENIPLLDCPDADIQRTYYFRWWTYRKHIKQTPNGWVVDEFMPDVAWAGKFNTISCAAGHHLYEGRWLRDPEYLDDYTTFWFRGGGEPRRYSFWVADAIWARFCVTGDKRLPVDLLPDLVKNFEAWEIKNRDVNGLYWQQDDRDGMEKSISGRLHPKQLGYRVTINSYQYGDALAIARMAELGGNADLARTYREKAAMIKKLVQEKLWDPGAEFFKVLPRGENTALSDVRELHGYTPWYFHLPDPAFDSAWKQAMDPQGFFAPFGLTSAEQRHPKFAIEYHGHECQWNGPVWPFSTAITLTAMANLLNDRPQSALTKADYFATLQCYARSHAMRQGPTEVHGASIPSGPQSSADHDNPQHRPDDTTQKHLTPRDVPTPDAAILNSADKQPWIDENLNPYTGDWISRTMLLKASGKIPERGKDYNHSTFCDPVISGLIGLRPRPDDTIEVNPLAPSEWNYFCLDQIWYHGRNLTIFFDRTGSHYGKGKGLHVFSDGKEIARSEKLERLTGHLPPLPR